MSTLNFSARTWWSPAMRIPGVATPAHPFVLGIRALCSSQDENVLAADIVTDLEAALKQFREIAGDLAPMNKSEQDTGA